MRCVLGHFQLWLLLSNARRPEPTRAGAGWSDGAAAAAAPAPAPVCFNCPKHRHSITADYANTVTLNAERRKPRSECLPGAEARIQTQ